MLNNIVAVILWGKEVGRLYWDDTRGVAVFTFHPDFEKQGLNITPLYSASTRLLPILGSKEKLYQGLPPFIADSLPDKWGSLVLEQWAKQHGISKREITPVDKLTFIGKRGMGALEYVPAIAIEGHQDSLQLESLYKLSQFIMEQRSTVSIDASLPMNIQTIFEVGTSAGGKHPKAIIAINEDTQEIRSGQTEQPEGFRYYILKFAEDDDFPFTTIEMAYYEMATAAGITMMPSRLVDIMGKKHFLTERYDRQGGEKVFTQTLAAIDPDALSYADLFHVCRSLSIPITEQEETYRRMVFNVLAGNVDDHTKNFSFMLDRKGDWHITPAYDMTFTVDLDGSGFAQDHAMAVSGKLRDIRVADLESFAKANGIKKSSQIIKEVATSVSNFHFYAKANGVNDYWTDRIEKYLSTLVPPEFVKAMQHWQPTVIAPYRIGDTLIEDIQLTENKRHEFILTAMINGTPCKHLFRKNSNASKMIIDDGGSKMSAVKLKQLVNQHLLNK